MKTGNTRASKLLLAAIAISAFTSATFAQTVQSIVPRDRFLTIEPMPPMMDGRNGEIFPAVNASVDYSWNQTTTGQSWSVNTNWTPTSPVGGPDAPGLYVVIGTNITAANTINLFNTGDPGDAVKTIGRLDIGDTNGSSSFTIAAGSGGGSLDFNGNGTNAQLNHLSTAGAADTISAPVTLSSSLDVTNSSANNMTISGAITGSGGLNLLAGIVTLTNAANTYSGASTLSGGQLRIDTDAEPGTGTLTLAGGSLVQTTSGRSPTSDPVTNNLVVTADSSINTTSNATTVDINFTGTLTGSGGTLTLTNTGADAATDTFNVRFSGGDYTMSRPINLDNGTGKVVMNEFNTTGTTHTYSGVISGTGSFNRSASSAGTGGVTVFTADNTYTGTTTVFRGTLQLGTGGTTGSLSPSSAINLSGSEGVLRFDHTSGADFVQGVNFSSSAITGSGSIIKEGTSSLTFNVANTWSGGLTINKGTVIATANGALGTGGINLNAPNVTLTLQGGTNPNFIADTATLTIGFNTDTVNLNYSGTEVVGGLIVEGTSVGPGTYSSADFSELVGTGTITVVPEPATIGMMILGAGLLAGVQRFRRKLG